MREWSLERTRLSYINNERVCKILGVALRADKMREARLRWFGHVLRFY